MPAIENSSTDEVRSSNENEDEDATQDDLECAASEKSTKENIPAEEKNVSTGKKSSRKKTLDTMITPSVRNLLCLVYMGLRYIHEPILLCDLIRLVYNNDLPYCYSGDIIPRELATRKENKKEFQRLFCSIYKKKFTMNHQELVTRLQNLHGLMDLPIYPSPDMAVIIARFIAILNLPKELNQYTYKLFSDCNPTLDKKVVSHGTIAMAFIIVTLRILFILDGNSEHRLSIRGQRLRSLMTPEVPVFVWDEWVCVVNLRRKQRISDGLTTDASDVHQVRNVDNFLTNYLKCSRMEDYKDLDTKTTRDEWHWRERRQKSFRVLENDTTTNKPVPKENAENMQPKPTSKGKKRKNMQQRPTSKGKKRKRTASCSSEHTSQKKPKKETIKVRKQTLRLEEHADIIWESRDDLLNKQFTEYSMKYLLDFGKFCADYELGDNQHWLVTGERNLEKDLNDDRKGEDEQSERKEGDSCTQDGNTETAEKSTRGNDEKKKDSCKSDVVGSKLKSKKKTVSKSALETKKVISIGSKPKHKKKKKSKGTDDESTSKVKTKKTTKKKKSSDTSEDAEKTVTDGSDAGSEPKHKKKRKSKGIDESKSKVKTKKKLKKKSSDTSENAKQGKVTDGSGDGSEPKHKEKKKSKGTDESKSKVKTKKTKKKLQKKSSDTSELVKLTDGSDVGSKSEHKKKKKKSKGTDDESTSKVKRKKKLKKKSSSSDTSVDAEQQIVTDSNDVMSKSNHKKETKSKGTDDESTSKVKTKKKLKKKSSSDTSEDAKQGK
ncbi:uncharacterized protein [Amphiura filiformis]|uniref:uncharacterized protein n=1 Tax=Amphiura filiformis TaxID=82378 RepID=UPI003B225DC5